MSEEKEPYVNQFYKKELEKIEENKEKLVEYRELTAEEMAELKEEHDELLDEHKQEILDNYKDQPKEVDTTVGDACEEGVILSNSKVDPDTMDRRGFVSPTPHGALCPYLDYKIIEVGYAIPAEDKAIIESGGVVDGCDPILTIQENLSGFVKPSNLEKEFFFETYGYQKEGNLNHHVEIDNPYADFVYTQVVNVLEDLKDHARHQKGAEIDAQRREDKNALLGSSATLEPAHMMYYFERYPLCRACEFEEGSDTKIKCDYRDWKSFGEEEEDLFPVCRRYEYYQTKEKPVDTHDRVLDFSGTNMTWQERGTGTNPELFEGDDE